MNILQGIFYVPHAFTACLNAVGVSLVVLINLGQAGCDSPKIWHETHWQLPGCMDCKQLAMSSMAGVLNWTRT